MKTDRLTLLVSPADKAAIVARAEQLGISVSELVRQAALGYDPDDIEAKHALESMLPEFSAAISRMDAAFDRMIERGEAHEARMAHLQSSDYREQVRARLAADPAIDWDRIAAIRDGALHARGKAA